MRQWLILPALLGVAACAQSGERPRRADSVNAADVAMTPISDLNLRGREVAEILRTAVDDPYSLDGMNTCDDIVAEIGKLDGVLVEDYDAYTEGGAIQVGRAAQSLVGSLIPFRGIVREVSGAAGRDRRIEAAIVAGLVRRGYLKGFGLKMGCPVPARPRQRPSDDPAGSEDAAQE